MLSIFSYVLIPLSGVIYILKIRNYNEKLLYALKASKKNSVEITKLKKGEKASILSDSMFKAMFLNSKRIKYSAKFLSYYLDISYEDLLKNIKLTKNELDKDFKDTKGERSDYVAEVDGTKINIEVNNNRSKEVMERNMEYAHRLYSEMIKEGDDYKYKYNQVIQFNLNNFSFIGNDKIIDIYTIRNDEGLILNNKLIFIQIYIPNLRKKWYISGIQNLSEEERFILGLVEPSMDQSMELGGDIDIMMEYVNEAGEVTVGTNFGEAYDKEWALQDEARREEIEIGKRDGIEIGKLNGKKEIILNMHKSGMNISEISKVTHIGEKEINMMIKE